MTHYLVTWQDTERWPSDHGTTLYRIAPRSQVILANSATHAEKLIASAYPTARTVHAISVKVDDKQGE